MTTPDSQPFVTFEWFDVDQETGQPTGDPVFRQEFTGPEWDAYYEAIERFEESVKDKAPKRERIVKVKLEVGMVIPPGSRILLG